MSEQPLTFQTKSALLSNNTEVHSNNLALRSGANEAQPSTCVDAEPYALQVLDDSMAPEFWTGCIILIDPTGRVTDGSYVLAMTVDSGAEGHNEPESYVFRQLRSQNDGRWTLDALNENYPSIETDKQFNNIAGVIVQRAGKRRHQHKRYD